MTEGGASREYLETLQSNYYEVLDRLEDKTYAGYFMRTTGDKDLLNEFQRDGMTDEVARKLQRLKTNEIKNMKRGKITDENQANDEEGDSEVDMKFQRDPKTIDAKTDRSSTTKDVYSSQKMTRAFDIRVLIPDARVVYGASDPSSLILGVLDTEMCRAKYKYINL